MLEEVYICWNFDVSIVRMPFRMSSWKITTPRLPTLFRTDGSFEFDLRGKSRRPTVTRCSFFISQIWTKSLLKIMLHCWISMMVSDVYERWCWKYKCDIEETGDQRDQMPYILINRIKCHTCWSTGSNAIHVDQRDQMPYMLINGIKCHTFWSTGSNAIRVDQRDQMPYMLINRIECHTFWSLGSNALHVDQRDQMPYMLINGIKYDECWLSSSCILNRSMNDTHGSQFITSKISQLAQEDSEFGAYPLLGVSDGSDTDSEGSSVDEVPKDPWVNRRVPYKKKQRSRRTDGTSYSPGEDHQAPCSILISSIKVALILTHLHWSLSILMFYHHIFWGSIQISSLIESRFP